MTEIGSSATLNVGKTVEQLKQDYEDTQKTAKVGIEHFPHKNPYMLNVSSLILSMSIYNASRLMVLHTTFVLLKKIPNPAFMTRSLRNALKALESISSRRLKNGASILGAGVSSG